MSRRAFYRNRSRRHSFIRNWLNNVGDLCLYCKRQMVFSPETGEHRNHSLQATIDHIVAVANGGPYLSKTNWQAICRSCNMKKADMSHDEFVAYMAQRPVFLHKPKPYRGRFVATYRDVWPQGQRPTFEPSPIDATRWTGKPVWINCTWPGRFHLIFHPDGLKYITLWLFGRRFHVCNEVAA